MGRAYQSLGDFDRAIIAYDLALALDPTYQQAYYNKGLAYQEEGMFVQALNRYHILSLILQADMKACLHWLLVGWSFRCAMQQIYHHDTPCMYSSIYPPYRIILSHHHITTPLHILM